MISWLKVRLDKIVKRLAVGLPQINPNWITLVGIIPQGLFFYFLVQHHYGWALISYLGVLLDSLDGAYARATNQQTRFGAFLDSLVDRASDSLIISAFGFAGLLSWSLVISLLVISFLISYARARGEALSPEAKLNAGPIERPQRMAIIFLGLLLFVIGPVKLGPAILDTMAWLLLALSVLTLLRRALRMRK